MGIEIFLPPLVRSLSDLLLDRGRNLHHFFLLEIGKKITIDCETERDDDVLKYGTIPKSQGLRKQLFIFQIKRAQQVGGLMPHRQAIVLAFFTEAGASSSFRRLTACAWPVPDWEA